MGSLVCVAMWVLSFQWFPSAWVDALWWLSVICFSAWTTPRTWVASEVLTASNMNTHVRDNENALRTGGLAVTSQAAGDLFYATSATQLARLPHAGAYVTVSGGTPTLAFGINVTSITDNGPGDFTINFTAALPSANFIAIACAVGTAVDKAASVHSKSTTSVRVLIITANNGAALDNVAFSVMCYGG